MFTVMECHLRFRTTSSSLQSCQKHMLLSRSKVLPRLSVRTPTSTCFNVLKFIFRGMGPLPSLKVCCHPWEEREKKDPLATIAAGQPSVLRATLVVVRMGEAAVMRAVRGVCYWEGGLVWLLKPFDVLYLLQLPAAGGPWGGGKGGWSLVVWASEK